MLYCVPYYIILGAEIIFNSSGSHHELRKLHKRIKLISDSMNKVSWCGNTHIINTGLYILTVLSMLYTKIYCKGCKAFSKTLLTNLKKVAYG